MRRIVIAFVLGFLSACALAVHAGGETVVQLGLKLSGFEHHYAFVATPDEAMAAAPLAVTRVRHGR